MNDCRRIAVLTLCASILLGASVASAVEFGSHEIEDLMAAGFPPQMIRAILEETAGDMVLSEADLERLEQAGLSPDTVAFLRSRAYETAAAAEAEEAAATVPEAATIYGSPLGYGVRYQYLYGYPYGGSYGAFGYPFVAGGFHHHHFDDQFFAGRSLDHHDPGHHEGTHFGAGDATHSGHHGGFAGGGHVGHGGHH